MCSIISIMPAPMLLTLLATKAGSPKLHARNSSPLASLRRTGCLVRKIVRVVECSQLWSALRVIPSSFIYAHDCESNFIVIHFVWWSALTLGCGEVSSDAVLSLWLLGLIDHVLIAPQSPSWMVSPFERT